MTPFMKSSRAASAAARKDTYDPLLEQQKNNGEDSDDESSSVLVGVFSDEDIQSQPQLVREAVHAEAVTFGCLSAKLLHGSSLERASFPRGVPNPTVTVTAQALRANAHYPIPEDAGVIECTIMRDRTGSNKFHPCYTMWLETGAGQNVRDKHKKDSLEFVFVGRLQLHQ